MTNPVKPGVARIRYVIAFVPSRKVEPVFGMMKCGKELHAMLFVDLREFSQNVTLRSHLRGIPLGILRVPHGETVMMLGDWTGKASAGFLE